MNVGGSSEMDSANFARVVRFTQRYRLAWIAYFRRRKHISLTSHGGASSWRPSSRASTGPARRGHLGIQPSALSSSDWGFPRTSSRPPNPRRRASRHRTNRDERRAASRSQHARSLERGDIRSEEHTSELQSRQY